MFGGEAAATREEAEAQWQRAKRTEKAAEESSEAPPPAAECAAAPAEARATQEATAAAAASPARAVVVPTATAPAAAAAPAPAVAAALLSASSDAASEGLLQGALGGMARMNHETSRGTAQEAPDVQAPDALPGMSDWEADFLRDAGPPSVSSEDGDED